MKPDWRKWRVKHITAKERGKYAPTDDDNGESMLWNFETLDSAMDCAAQCCRNGEELSWNVGTEGVSVAHFHFLRHERRHHVVVFCPTSHA